MDLLRDHFRSLSLRDDRPIRHADVGRRGIQLQRDCCVENGEDGVDHVASDRALGDAPLVATNHREEREKALEDLLLDDCREIRGCTRRRRGGCQRYSPGSR